jgi:hypothetical protein
MNWIWRALVAGLLLGGTIFWVPAMSTAASGPYAAAGSTVRGPATQDNNEDDNDADDNTEDDNSEDNKESDNENINDNVDDNENLNDNASDNENDNDTNEPSVNPGGSNVTGDPSNAGMQVQNGDLTVDLWRSNDHPVANTPFQMGVTGSGAPIERVWIWAESPGGENPQGDDFALAGEHSFTCNGANPCTQNWNFIARNVGYYNIHARVRDTSGREVQTDWFVLFSSNPR